jgi:tetratricopeptide (TPR) repeat protein
MAKKTNNTPISGLIPTPLWLILGVTLIAYHQVFRLPLIDWDDWKYITQNSITRGGFTLDNFKRIFTEPVMGNYHPLTMISYLINFSIWGEKPAIYHIVNLLLHLINVWQVWTIGQRITQRPIFASFLSLGFALHPIHVESVAWAAERKDVLYFFFFLLAIRFWINFQKSENYKTYAFSLLAFIAACLSKGMAVTLPFWIIGFDYFQGKFNNKQLIKYLPFIALSIIFGIIAIDAQQSQGGIKLSQPFDWIDRIVLALQSISFYVEKLIFPWGLSAIYPYPSDGVLDWIFYLRAFITLGILGACIYFGRTNRYIAFGAAMFVLTLLPVLQILPVGEAFAADRYMYAAALGVWWILAWGLNYIWEHYPAKRNFIFILPFIWLILTIRQTGFWKDEITLFQHSLDNYPDAPVAWNNIGAILQRKEKFAEAITYYTEAVNRDPDYAMALCNLGISHGRQGNFDQAGIYLSRAVKADSAYAEAWGNLGNVYAMKGDKVMAGIIFHKAVKLQPDYVEAIYNLGIWYSEEKDTLTSIRYFKRSVEINPNFGAGWWSYGNMLFRSGDTAAAVEALRTSASKGHAGAEAWLRANKLK